jgi:hypothetical protein
MKLRGPAAAAMLVLLANAWALVGVARNRAGEPEAEIVLTERELPLLTGENPEGKALAFGLSWRRPALTEDDELPWLDERKLQEIGFDARVPLSSAEAAEYYQRQAPRSVYVVLEYEGPSWDDTLARLRRRLDAIRERSPAAPEMKAEEDRLAMVEGSGSRLIPIDAGTDPAALRSKHPDRLRTILLPGVVRVTTWFRLTGTERKRSPGPVATGRMERLLVDRLSVPAGLRDALDTLPPVSMEGAGPRYEVTLRIGRKLEPWIAGIRPLPPASHAR